MTIMTCALPETMNGRGSRAGTSLSSVGCKQGDDARVRSNGEEDMTTSGTPGLGTIDDQREEGEDGASVHGQVTDCDFFIVTGRARRKGRQSEFK